MKQFLERIVERKSFTRHEASKIMEKILQNDTDPILIGAFLSAMNMKKVTVEEIAGFIDTLRNHAICPDISTGPVIDVCGTGGDGKHTFNISTLAGIVVATAGHAVVKHGNAAVTSNCGSSDILNAMGMTFTNVAHTLQEQLDRTSFCYLHAPLFHPALKVVGPVRRRLKIKTFFNQLGPLVNPIHPEIQLTGVFNMETLRLYAALLPEYTQKFAVVHSLDGYDEISLTAPFKLISHEGEFLLKPEELGLPTAKPHELIGSDTPDGNIRQFQKILNGQGTRIQSAVVAINAGVALHLAESITFRQGFDKAMEILHSGDGMETLHKAIEISNQGE